MGKAKNAKAQKPSKPAKHTGNAFGIVKISPEIEEKLRTILEVRDMSNQHVVWRWPKEAHG